MQPRKRAQPAREEGTLTKAGGAATVEPGEHMHLLEDLHNRYFNNRLQTIIIASEAADDPVFTTIADHLPAVWSEDAELPPEAQHAAVIGHYPLIIQTTELILPHDVSGKNISQHIASIERACGPTAYALRAGFGPSGFVEEISGMLSSVVLRKGIHIYRRERPGLLEINADCRRKERIVVLYLGREPIQGMLHRA